MGVIQGEPFVETPAAPDGIIAASEGGKTYVLWDKAKGDPQSYKVYLGTQSGKYTSVYETKDTKLVLPGLVPAKDVLCLRGGPLPRRQRARADRRDILRGGGAHGGYGRDKASRVAAIEDSLAGAVGLDKLSRRAAVTASRRQ